MLLCFPDEAAARPGYRRAYEALVARLPSTTGFTILCGHAAVDTLAKLLAGAGVVDRAEVVVAPADLRFTVWAQDASVVLDGRILLRPRSFDRDDDGRVPEVLEAHGVVTTRPTSLQFVGAHVLVGDDFALVAGDADGDRDAFAAALGVDRVIVVATERDLPEETLRPCAHDANRLELVHRGIGRALPIDHLDMFVTLAGRGPGGRYRVLVGSPALADDLLGRPPVAHALQDAFDDVAALLATAGFDVIRNPLPLTFGDGRRTVDGAVRDVRLWYHATANNCLVQIDEDGGDHVWLPTYGHGGWQELAATDAANRAIWERLGFTVHELPGFHAFAQRLGALRCIAKELERGPVGAGAK